MRYAILSDIHGNLEALTAVLDTLRGMDIDAYACLGDLVGYGADPNETVSRIRGIGGSSVLGNHDAAVIQPAQRTFFNMQARSAVEWTDRELAQEHRDYLAQLPLADRLGSALLVHASPAEPGAWRYITSLMSAALEFSSFDEQLCLVGHSHVPMIVELGRDGPRELFADEVTLAPGARYIINVGSIGQPRDGNPAASFGIVDDEATAVSIVRTEYDVETARRKIIDAGLPRLLGDRLLLGQ